MRQLADFVERMISEPGAPARPDGQGGDDRRTGPGRAPAGRSASSASRATGATTTSSEYGAVAATAFDEIIVREDKNLRGRPARRVRRERRGGVKEARAAGRARTVRAEKILDEMTAVRAALRRAAPGDLVVMCVDDAVGVYREAMAAARGPAGPTAFTDPGELEAPEG